MKISTFNQPLNLYANHKISKREFKRIVKHLMNYWKVKHYAITLALILLLILIDFWYREIKGI